jgi:GH24 family phage-related lysozyme (muramidase)
MPKLPVTPGPQVTLQPDVTFQTPISDVGAGQVAQAAGQFAAEGLKQREDFLERDATARALELDTQWRKIAREMAVGEEGYLRTKGRAAVDSHDDYSQAYQDARGKFLGAIPDERVRGMLDISTTAQMNQALNEAGRHQASQFEAAETESIAGHKFELINDSALRFKDDQALFVNSELYMVEADMQARRRGLTGSDRAEFMDRERSAYWTPVISHAISQDPIRGREMLDAAKAANVLDAVPLQELETQLATADDNRIAQQAADELFVANPNPKDRAKAFEQLKNMNLSGKQRQFAELSLNRAYAAAEAAEKATADDIVKRGAGAASELQLYEAWLDDNPDDARFIAEHPEVEKSLRETFKLNQELKDHPNVSDETRMEEIFGDDELITRNLELDKPFLSKEDYDTFVEQQQKERSAATGDAKSRAQFGAVQRAVAATADEDFPTKLEDMSNAERSRKRSIEFSLSKWIQDQASNPDRPPATPEEITDRAAELWRETRESAERNFISRIFTDPVSVGEVDAETRREMAKAQAAGVIPLIHPDNDPDQELVNNTRTFLRQSGLPDDDVLVGKLIQAKRAGDVGAIQRLLNPTPPPPPIVPRRPITDQAPDLGIESQPAPEAPAADVSGLAERGTLVTAEQGQAPKAPPTDVSGLEERGTVVRGFETPEAPQSALERFQDARAEIDAGRAQEAPESDLADEGTGGGLGLISAAGAAESPGVATPPVPGENPASAVDTIARSVDQTRFAADATPLEASFIDAEGFSNTVYLDSKGIPTIGIGFNLDKAGARARIEALGKDFDAMRAGTEVLDDDEARLLFAEDVADARQEAATIVPSTLPDQAMDAVTELVFNMGLPSVKGFGGMLRALNQTPPDFDRAALELEFVDPDATPRVHTDYFNDVGERRARRVIDALRGA